VPENLDPLSRLVRNLEIEILDEPDPVCHQAPPSLLLI
jgi:hypothetical protein